MKAGRPLCPAAKLGKLLGRSVDPWETILKI